MIQLKFRRERISEYINKTTTQRGSEMKIFLNMEKYNSMFGY